MGKPVQHGGAERFSKVFVSLEDLTSLRGDELLQGLYLIFFGSSLSHLKQKLVKPQNATEIPMKLSLELEEKELNTLKEELDDDEFNKSIATTSIDQFFFGWFSPIFMIPKGRRYLFPAGLPLYYGRPLRQTSIYLAVLDVGVPTPNKKNFEEFWDEDISKNLNLKPDLKESLTSFLKIKKKQKELEETPKGIVGMSYVEDREEQIATNFKKVKKAYSLLIKALETKALSKGHQIRYSNVFTFRGDEEWLEGGHSDWGDHRMAMTINVNVAP